METDVYIYIYIDVIVHLFMQIAVYLSQHVFCFQSASSSVHYHTLETLDME